MPVAPFPSTHDAESPFTPADMAMLRRWEGAASRRGVVVLRAIDEETEEESLITVRAHDGVPYVAIGLTTPAGAHRDPGSNDNEPDIAYQVFPSAGAWAIFDCNTAGLERFTTLQEALEAIAPLAVAPRDAGLQKP